MNIGVLPDYRWHRYARLYRIPLVGEFVLAAATRSSVRRVLQAGTRRRMPEAFVDDVLRQYRNPATRHAVLAFYRDTHSLGPVTMRAAAAMSATQLPTLVVWGAGDPYVPGRYADVQRQFFPRAKVFVLPDSGHWPLVDDPAAVSDAVVGFLRDHVPTAESEPPHAHT
jgi:pimeloyl-ACP methyl ester carboxylesterase